MNQTLQDMITSLQTELEQTEQDVQTLEQQLRAKRERAAYLRGRIDSYTSIQIVEQNPATVEHD